MKLRLYVVTHPLAYRGQLVEAQNVEHAFHLMNHRIGYVPTLMLRHLPEGEQLPLESVDGFCVSGRNRSGSDRS